MPSLRTAQETCAGWERKVGGSCWIMYASEPVLTHDTVCTSVLRFLNLFQQTGTTLVSQALKTYGSWVRAEDRAAGVCLFGGSSKAIRRVPKCSKGGKHTPRMGYRTMPSHRAAQERPAHPVRVVSFDAKTCVSVKKIDSVSTSRDHSTFSVCQRPPPCAAPLHCLHAIKSARSYATRLGLTVGLVANKWS